MIPVFLAIAAAGAGVAVDLLEAESAFARGDYREAYRQAREAIPADPGDARAWLIAHLEGRPDRPLAPSR